jgi:hypothetical protein
VCCRHSPGAGVCVCCRLGRCDKITDCCEVLSV